MYHRMCFLLRADEPFCQSGRGRACVTEGFFQKRGCIGVFIDSIVSYDEEGGQKA